MSSEEEAYPHALPIGTKLNRYDVVDILGQGGFGIIYLANDSLLNIRVAIKEFFPLFLKCVRGEGGVVAMPLKEKQELFEKCRTMFIEEARNLARFRHENIVRILSFFEETTAPTW